MTKSLTGLLAQILVTEGTLDETKRVIDIIPDVLRHRLVLSYEALSESVTADQIIAQVLRAVPAPEKLLEAHVKFATAS